MVPPDQYDRNTSSADDTDKRPLGYEYDIAKYLGVQSGGNLTNPCAYLRYLTARNVEVMVSLRLVSFLEVHVHVVYMIV